MLEKAFLSGVLEQAPQEVPKKGGAGGKKGTSKSTSATTEDQEKLVKVPVSSKATTEQIEGYTFIYE